MKGASGYTGFMRAAAVWRHQRQTGLPGEARALAAGGRQKRGRQLCCLGGEARDHV